MPAAALNDEADVLTVRREPRISGRKIRDRSIALLLVGIMLLLPPIAGMSHVDSKIGGVPVSLLYVFVVWAFLIAGAAALSRPLLDSQSTAPSGENDDLAG